jgi:hypothetical protein
VRHRYRPYATCCLSRTILGELRDRYALTAQPSALTAPGAPLVKHTNHPVRVHEVINRRALPQEFGVGYHIKVVGHTPAGQFLGYPEPHLAGRAYGYGTLVHYYPVAISGWEKAIPGNAGLSDY